MRLEDKVAVIVGAGQSPGEGIGNGRATTLRFAQEGARILAIAWVISGAATCRRGGLAGAFFRRDHAGACALRPQHQLAASAARRPSAIRCLPWQPARRSRKSPLRARGLARTMSASSLPGTSGLAASNSATREALESVLKDL